MVLGSLGLRVRVGVVPGVHPGCNCFPHPSQGTCLFFGFLAAEFPSAALEHSEGKEHAEDLAQVAPSHTPVFPRGTLGQGTGMDRALLIQCLLQGDPKPPSPPQPQLWGHLQSSPWALEDMQI